METVIQTLLSLVGGLMPTIESAVGASTAGAAIVEKIIASLEVVVPSVISLVPTLKAEVQGVIASLQNGSTPLTADQITTLDNLSDQVNVAFEADAQAAGYAPPAAS